MSALATLRFTSRVSPRSFGARLSFERGHIQEPRDHDHSMASRQTGEIAAECGDVVGGFRFGHAAASQRPLVLSARLCAVQSKALSKMNRKGPRMGAPMSTHRLIADRFPVQAVFNATGRVADLGCATRAAGVVAASVALVLTALGGLS